MDELLQNVVSSSVFWWGMGGSVLMLLVMLAATAGVLVLLPADVLQQERKSLPLRLTESSWGVCVLLVLKNLLAVLFLVAGFLMLFLPGQGLLALLAGLLLLDFPGKQRLELWILRRKAVKQTVNWLREQFDQPELDLRDESQE